jgi:putative hydrolase of the HAD superfamily
VATRVPRYDAVFFDLDGTLCDYDESARLGRAGAFDVLLDRHPGLNRMQVEREFLDIVDSRLDPAAKREFFDTPLDPASLTFVKLGERLGAPDRDFAVELGLIYRDLRHEHLRLFEGYQAMVEALKGKVHLGIVTNGRSDVQRGEIDALGIAEHFDTIIVSGEVNARKPQKEIFDLATAAAGCSPEKALFCGDDPITDIDGAVRACWGAAWVNRNGSGYPERLAEPSYVVAGLTEVVSLVAGEG